MNAANQLRKLIDAYYEGSSTPADIETIQRLFDQLPELPEDLAADKKIFEAFSAEALDSAPCPPHLETMMNETISRLTSTKSTKANQPQLLWIKIASIAAAVAVILGISFAFIHNDRLDISTATHPYLLSHNDQPKKEYSDAITESGQTDADTAIVCDIRQEHRLADSSTQHPAKHPTTVKPAETTVKKSDIKVITDPAEAEMHTLLALNCLSKGLNSAREATRQTDKAITNINQKLKTILK